LLTLIVDRDRPRSSGGGGIDFGTDSRQGPGWFTFANLPGVSRSCYRRSSAEA
jgi:hypothetical protein